MKEYDVIKLKSNFEDFFEAENFIKHNQSTEEYLFENSLDTIKEHFTSYLFIVKKESPFIITLSMFHSFSELFYILSEENINEELRFKSKQTRKHLDVLIIEILSPKLLEFFNWDFKRRLWKGNSNIAKIEYLESVIHDLSRELNGEVDSLLEKYSVLLIEYFEEIFTDTLSNPETLKELEKYDSFEKIILFKVLEKLDKLKGIISIEGIDKDRTLFILDYYKPLAKDYLSGLLSTEKRYNSLFLAFIEAQCLYRDSLNSYLETIKNDNGLLHLKVNQILLDGNFEEFVEYLKSIFASIPNVLIKNTNESYYHIFVHLVLKMSNVNIESEVNTNLGRIDMVIENSKSIIVVEMKMDNNNDAMEQIHSKKYYERYLIENKEIELLGLTFSEKERNIVKFEHKTLDENEIV